MTPLKQIRLAILTVIIGLVLSGVTAFPLLHELNLLADLLAGGSRDPSAHDGLIHWILFVREGLEVTYQRYPFIAYGTDWLAFGHVVIALVFIGAWKDPVRNRWLYQFAMLAGVLVVPWAMVFGALRGIPLWWRCIDSLFGIGAIVPAWWCHRWACSLEQKREPGLNLEA